MEKSYFLKSRTEKYYNRYKVSDILEIKKKETGYLVQNYEIDVKGKGNNILDFKLCHGEKRICELNFELEMTDRFERENNKFVLKINKNNEIEEILNKKEMADNIDNKLFQYMEENIKNSGKIMDLVYLYKKQLENKGELEFFMNTEGMSSYFFINIFDKEYFETKETKIIKYIGNIVPEVAIPVELKFKIKKLTENELLLYFTSDYSGMASYANIVSAYKEYLQLPEYEKFEFYLDIKGQYTIDTKENKLKKYNVLREFSLGDNTYNRQIIAEGIWR